MANPRGLNGSDVVLIVDDTQIPAQRSASQNETTAVIDMSSKDSRATRRAPGRYDCKLNLTALYLPGASGFDQLRTKFRNGDYIDVIRSEPAGGVSWPRDEVVPSGIETCSAIVTEMSPQFPDQDAATVTLAIEIDGAWESV